MRLLFLREEIGNPRGTSNRGNTLPASLCVFVESVCLCKISVLWRLPGCLVECRGVPTIYVL